MKAQATHSVHHREAVSFNENSPEGDFYVSLIARVLELLDENDIIFYDPKQQIYFLFRNSGAARNKALPLCDAFVEDLVHWLVERWPRKNNGITAPDLEYMNPWSKKKLRALVWWRVGRAECFRFVVGTGKFAKNGATKNLRKSTMGLFGAVR